MPAHGRRLGSSAGGREWKGHDHSGGLGRPFAGGGVQEVNSYPAVFQARFIVVPVQAVLEALGGYLLWGRRAHDVFGAGDVDVSEAAVVAGLRVPGCNLSLDVTISNAGQLALVCFGLLGLQ